jgi:hypothetical protein
MPRLGDKFDSGRDQAENQGSEAMDVALPLFNESHWLRRWTKCELAVVSLRPPAKPVAYMFVSQI